MGRYDEELKNDLMREDEDLLHKEKGEETDSFNENSSWDFLFDDDDEINEYYSRKSKKFPKLSDTDGS